MTIVACSGSSIDLSAFGSRSSSIVPQSWKFHRFDTSPCQSPPGIVNIEPDRDACVFAQLTSISEGLSDYLVLSVDMLEEGDQDDRDKDAASRL